MTYETRITRLTVLPKGGAIFSEQATDLEIDDEAAGEFLVIKQHRENEPGDGQKVSFDPQEWPHIVAAADQLIKSMKKP